MCITQPCSEYLTREGASKKLKWLSLIEEAMKAFKALKQACMTAPVLVSANYTKPFLLETDASKDGLGAVLLQKQADGQYHPIAYGSRALMPHEKKLSLNQTQVSGIGMGSYRALYRVLPYQPFVVWTDNNPLTYIMSTSNLDAMGHQWVGFLAQFNLKLENQKVHNNMMVDILS